MSKEFYSIFLQSGFNSSWSTARIYRLIIQRHWFVQAWPSDTVCWWSSRRMISLIDTLHMLMIYLLSRPSVSAGFIITLKKSNYKTWQFLIRAPTSAFWFHLGAHHQDILNLKPNLSLHSTDQLCCRIISHSKSCFTSIWFISWSKVWCDNTEQLDFSVAHLFVSTAGF